MSRLKQKTIGGVLCSFLVACGGDGGSMPSDSTNSPQSVSTNPAGTSQTLASAARFDAPHGIVVDAVGNLYVADSGNNTIRKISPSGKVSTIAGAAGQTAPVPEQFGSGDGIGAAARFNLLAGLTVDGGGNLYVGDTYGHTGKIRKISQDGTVTTLLADVYALGVTVDDAGEVYVAANGRGMHQGVFKLTPGGSVTQLAMMAGRAIAIDASKKLYVADTGRDYGPRGATSFSCLIATVTSSGTTATLAGKHAEAMENTCGYADGEGTAAKFFGSEAIAVDAQGNLYVADTLNHIIRKVTPAGSVTTLAGLPGAAGSADGAGANARFNAPKGITIDSAGNLYVADTGNHTIRKVSAAGNVTTIAGAAGQPGSSDI
jgi:sugar lactone lactonase YvrE